MENFIKLKCHKHLDEYVKSLELLHENIPSLKIMCVEFAIEYFNGYIEGIKGE